LPLQSQQIARQCARIEEAAVQCLVEGRAIARAQKVRALHVQQAAFDRVGDFRVGDPESG
jgi:hypothetical protein